MNSGQQRETQAVAQAASVFLPPFDALDDAALLAHFRSARPVFVDPVADPEETRPEKIDALLAGRFEFYGETHALPDPLPWLHNPSVDVEWHILLHKFYYAVGLGLAWQRSGDARYAQRWAQLIDGWMAVTPPGFIAADVTGRRVQNWIYSHRQFVGPGIAAPVDAGFHRRMLLSLHEQVEHLCAHLTPKRNHRTLELMAILLAGVAFPEMKRAAFWREFALRETVANVQADLLPDGVHCELSTDYHHLALRNWLHVRRLAARHGLPVAPALDEALQRALGFSLHVHAPGGVVPSFSDGDARDWRALLDEGATLFGREDLRFVASLGAAGTPPATRMAHFADSGYHVIRSDWHPAPAFRQAQHLVFDCGPLGEGNHGHFDALSFELFAQGRPLVVDPGRFTYSEAGDTNWRVHFRGTAAHNTVCVDGLTQTAYRPKPVDTGSRHASGALRHRIAGPAPDTVLLEAASHPALDLLLGLCSSHAYDARHERCIAFVDGAFWIVSDSLRAPTTHSYTLRFQLGAEAQGALLEQGAAWRSPGLCVAAPVGEALQVVPGWVSPRYGQRHAAPALQAQVQGHDADFDTVLWPTESLDAALAVQRYAVLGQTGAQAWALRIERREAGVAQINGWFHARGAAPQAWLIAGCHFRGRWLAWREDDSGRIVQAVSHAGASLRGAPLQVAEGRP
ncbi:MAG: alginate lyase family protein [Rubrivivax sp.]|nr:alginate lyase family protein [Rubrivivax sp.]